MIKVPVYVGFCVNHGLLDGEKLDVWLAGRLSSWLYPDRSTPWSYGHVVLAYAPDKPGPDRWDRSCYTFSSATMYEGVYLNRHFRASHPYEWHELMMVADNVARARSWAGAQCGPTFDKWSRYKPLYDTSPSPEDKTCTCVVYQQLAMMDGNHFVDPARTFPFTQLRTMVVKHPEHRLLTHAPWDFEVF